MRCVCDGGFEFLLITGKQKTPLETFSPARGYVRLLTTSDSPAGPPTYVKLIK